jgi:hypothetical protein
MKSRFDRLLKVKSPYIPHLQDEKSEAGYAQTSP